MKIDIFDHNVSLTMNIFLVMANCINIIYNIPQMVKTYKSKSTKDFSATFLLLRFLGNIIWVGYSIEIKSMMMIINNSVTVISSMFIGYYKVIEIIDSRKYKYIDNIDTIPIEIHSV